MSLDVIVSPKVEDLESGIYFTGFKDYMTKFKREILRGLDHTILVEFSTFRSGGKSKTYYTGYPEYNVCFIDLFTSCAPGVVLIFVNIYSCNNSTNGIWITTNYQNINNHTPGIKNGNMIIEAIAKAIRTGECAICM